MVFSDDFHYNIKLSQMILQKLLQEYKNLLPSVRKVYVVPLFNLKLKESDYMYLLYKDIIEGKINSSISIESLSVFAHPKFFFKKIAGEKSLLHYNWLEVTDFKSFFGMLWKLFWITAYKLIGGRIIWTIHNKFPHNNNFKMSNKIFRRYMASIADKLHVHCNYAVEQMSRILNVGKSKFIIIEHPVYPAVIMERTEAIKLLEKKYHLNLAENKKIFLVFGAIAKYKGIKEIIGIFKQEIRNHYLIVAGVIKKGSQKYFNELKNESAGCSNIILLGEMIPNEDLPLFFNSSDCVVFNYEEILTSGGVMTALSFGKKVIAPSIGCISEIKDENIYLFQREAGKDDNLKNTLLSLIK